MLHTRFCERFGVAAPIAVAPMGPDLAGPELVAAVCNAGGFGILQAQLCPPSLLTHLRTLTDKQFGVNFVLHFPHRDGIQVCLEERVAALSFFWGDPSEFMPAAHAAGIAVLHQVGTVDAAVRAQQAGVDVIIAQGVEAGGHVAGQVSTMVLLPRIVDAVAPALVLAAGDIADARGLAAALCLGADGVVMGTRFLATPEANTHPVYKAALVAASEGRHRTHYSLRARMAPCPSPNVEHSVRQEMDRSRGRDAGLSTRRTRYRTHAYRWCRDTDSAVR
jgi:nitronate monooxygenase